MSLNGDEYSFPTSYLHQGYLIFLGCYNRLNGSLNITLHLPLDNEWHYKTENRWRHIYIHNVLDYNIYVNYDFTFANTIILSFNEYFTTLSSLTSYVYYMERKHQWKIKKLSAVIRELHIFCKRKKCFISKSILPLYRQGVGLYLTVHREWRNHAEVA